jgi:hypothetical protein
VWVDRAAVTRLEAEVGEEEVEGATVVTLPGSTAQVRLFRVDAGGEPLEIEVVFTYGTHLERCILGLREGLSWR